MTPLGFASYRFASEPGAGWRSGIVINNRVVDAESLGAPVSLKEALALGGKNLQDLVGEASAESRHVLPLTEVDLGPPVPDPEKIICIGLNYREHASEAGFDLPSHPIIFSKFANGLVGDQATVYLPPVTARVDYEGELAVVIGAKCRHIGADEALRYVAGYAVFNDLSARDLQMRTTQFTAGKILDGFAPFGPWITPSWEVPDPQQLQIETRVNGTIVQNGSTSDMIFSVAELIADVSQILTLQPGDIIATGTPAGVGMAAQPPRFLSEGDEVEIAISSIGVLRTRFSRERRDPPRNPTWI